jgi:hypothetical protein
MKVTSIRAIRALPRTLLIGGFLLGVAASCAGGDGEAELPPDDGPALLDDDDDATPFGDDDSAGPIDDTPANSVRVVEEGIWTRSPEGGPYTALTGAVTHVEFWDGVAPPDPDDPEDPGGPEGFAGPNCRLEFAVTAVPAQSDPGCPGCTTWDYTVRLDSGEPRWCLATDRFENGDAGRFGWSPTDRAIYIDYEGLGIWLFLYSGLEDDDDLWVEWTGEFGFTPPEVDD